MEPTCDICQVDLAHECFIVTLTVYKIVWRLIKKCDIQWYTMRIPVHIIGDMNVRSSLLQNAYLSHITIHSGFEPRHPLTHNDVHTSSGRKIRDKHCHANCLWIHIHPGCMSHTHSLGTRSKSPSYF